MGFNPRNSLPAEQTCRIATPERWLPRIDVSSPSIFLCRDATLRGKGTTELSVETHESWDRQNDDGVAQESTYLVAIPEPSLSALGSLSALLLLRRRR